MDLDDLSDLSGSTCVEADPKLDEPKMEDPLDLKLYRKHDLHMFWKAFFDTLNTSL